MTTSLLDRITTPNRSIRTWNVLCIAKAIALRNADKPASDESTIVRALVVCAHYGLDDWFDMAPRSIGLVRGDIAEVLAMYRQELLK